MASYVLTNKGEVIYLNTDAPLAPGDPTNKQLSPESLGDLADIYGPQNFYVNEQIAQELIAKPAYATGATSMEGAPLASAVQAYVPTEEMGGALAARYALLKTVEKAIFGDNGFGFIEEKFGFSGYEGANLDVRGASFAELPRIRLR